MKINMKHGEEKGGSVNKIRIAVFGQHDVGKSGKTRKISSLTSVPKFSKIENK